MEGRIEEIDRKTEEEVREKVNEKPLRFVSPNTG